MKYFLSVIAMVLIIEGLPYFAFPHTMKETLRKISDSNPNSLRLLGFTLIVIGLILLYFFKQ